MLEKSCVASTSLKDESSHTLCRCSYGMEDAQLCGSTRFSRSVYGV